MNQQPDISIITINYNGLKETCQLIESLQQYPQDCSYELIVVDNGSIQNEALLLQKKYPEVHVIRNEQNVGFSPSRPLMLTLKSIGAPAAMDDVFSFKYEFMAAVGPDISLEGTGDIFAAIGSWDFRPSAEAPIRFPILTTRSGSVTTFSSNTNF